MNRRDLLKGLSIISGSACFGVALARAAQSPLDRFKLGAISDGFSQDFAEALKILKGYGLPWVEIRNVWGVYNTEATPAQIQRIKDLLNKYQCRVSVVDTALYKCVLPGTKAVGGEKDLYPYAGQMDLLQRAIERARALGTDKLRIFTFWRTSEPTRVFDRISEELAKAAQIAHASGMRLLIENESACNVATGREVAQILKMTPASNLGANWDVGNGWWQGEVSFPDGYAALDKRRLWHLHVKGVRCEKGITNCQETTAGQGANDLLGQFHALVRDGYEGTMSLECEVESPGMTHLATTKRSLEELLQILSKTTG